MTWSPKRGDVVNVAAGTKNNRPGVVYRVEDQGVLITYVATWGTGTDPEQRRKNGDPHDPFVAVEKDSPEGQALALDKDTWFYPGEHGHFELTGLSPRPGASVCPRSLLDNLTRLHRSR
jgi:hypothetical protein